MARRRNTEVFSLSFLDCICCGFGAVVLIYMIIAAQNGARQMHKSVELSAEVNLLEEQVIDGYKNLAVLRNTLQKTDQEKAQASGRADRVLTDIARMQQELAEYQGLNIAKRDKVTTRPGPSVGFGYGWGGWRSHYGYDIAFMNRDVETVTEGTLSIDVVDRAKNELMWTGSASRTLDSKVLDQAEKWCKTAAENGGLPEYYLTLAEIYKRQGDKDKARSTAEKARKAMGEKDNGMGGKIDYFIQSLEG